MTARRRLGAARGATLTEDASATPDGPDRDATLSASFAIPIIRQWPAQAPRALTSAVSHLEHGGNV